MKTSYETLVDWVIQAEVEGKPRHELVLEISPTTPEILRRQPMAFEARRLVIKGKTVAKVYFDHGIVTATLYKLLTLVEHARGIFRSATRGDSVIVISVEAKQGAPLIVTIARDQPVGRELANVVTSVYAKEGPDPERKWTEAGLLLWHR